jgi:hypothetical protein
LGFKADILVIISFMEAIWGEAGAPVLPWPMAEWSMPAMLPCAAVSAEAAGLAVAVAVSADWLLLQLLSNTLPENRAARKKTEVFMGMVELR